MNISKENDAFHARRAHNYVRAAIRELATIRRMNLVQTSALRQLYSIEDALWQINEQGENNRREDEHADS